MITSTQTDETPKVKVSRPLLEVLCVFAFFVLYDFVFREGDRFAGLDHHPFWIPVLLFSVHYGTTVGIFSALCATFALLAGNLPIEMVDEGMYSYWRRAGSLPMFWLITSVVLGEMALRQRNALRRAQDELEESISREELLCEAFTELEYVKQIREREIAALTSSSVQILDVISGASLRDPAAIMERVLELVSLALQPKKFSLYVVKEDSLSLALAKGWSADDRFGTRFSKTSDLYKSVINDAEVLTILDADKAKFLGAEGVMAAPLVDIRSNQVLGMIKLEDLDWSHVTAQNITLLRLIGEWSGSTYMFAQEFHQTKPRASKRGGHLSDRAQVKALAAPFTHQPVSLESQ